jgi:hypothetical protein
MATCRYTLPATSHQFLQVGPHYRHTLYIRHPADCDVGCVAQKACRKDGYGPFAPASRPTTQPANCLWPSTTRAVAADRAWPGWARGRRGDFLLAPRRPSGKLAPVPVGWVGRRGTCISSKHHTIPAPDCIIESPTPGRCQRWRPASLLREPHKPRSRPILGTPLSSTTDFLRAYHGKNTCSR